MDKKYKRTYVKVNLENIRHNILEARRNIKDSTKIMAIVKANAYGHGAVEVSNALYDIVDAYGVAVITEAIELRQANIEKMILILGYTPKEYFEEVVRYDISQTVYNFEMAAALNEEGKKQGKIAKIHIKLDTGMGRIGFLLNDESLNSIKKIKDLDFVEIEGCFTHFANADRADESGIVEPFKKYNDFIEKLEENNIVIPIKHVSNSAAIINYPTANLNMVRSGITTYGLYPSNEVRKDIMKLKPAMEWKSFISNIKEVETGTGISYGSTFVANRPMKIATIPVGYADGYKRDLSNKGKILINGQYANITGRICMDQFMVDVSNIDNVKINDEVTLFGIDGQEYLSVEEVADLCHSFNYEFVCTISNRVPRMYI